MRPDTTSIKKICLVIPSLTSGGMERVMTVLANQFYIYSELKITLLLMSRQERFYNLSDKILLVEPLFCHKKYNRWVFTLKTFTFIRRALKRIQPDAILSFGGKYNAFVLLAAVGLDLRIFVSDRSRPSISYGRFLDWLNPIIYRKASGIIAQTSRAKEFLIKRVNHQNIKVIGNPIQSIGIVNNSPRENVILNVGRFIPSKQQALLVEIFAKLEVQDWQLIFLGAGAELARVKAQASSLGLASSVIFKGNVSKPEEFYLASKIFAFTTISEGFPNALGEAMAAGCACISFDCEAGPSELIDDGINGFLVPVGDHETYKSRLQQLLDDEELRISFGNKAQEKMKQFRVDKIANEYLDFILPNREPDTSLV